MIDSENLIAMRHTDKERKEELEKRNRENKKRRNKINVAKMLPVESFHWLFNK